MASKKIKTQADYPVQVSSEVYFGVGYLTPQRWSSYAIAIREVMELRPQRILEIGPGNGIVTDVLRKMGLLVKTLDFDPTVLPDYVASVTDARALKILEGKFDLIIACEIFEHLKYEDFQKAIELLKPVAPKMLVSVPHSTLSGHFFHLAFKIPGLRRFSSSWKWVLRPTEHIFNGQHYWEMGKRGFPVSRICADFEKAGWSVRKRFFNPENPYHYFFVLEQK